jgi:hypothetical protein
MARYVTRRTALRVIGGVTAAAAGAFAGLLPEASLRAAAAGGGFADAARGRQFVLRQRTGEATRNARAATALARPSGAIARRFLATHGFPGKIQSVESADVLWSDGEHIGTIDNVVFYDKSTDRYGHLLRQVSKDREVVGVVLWARAHPESCEVYDVRGGSISLSATVTRSADGTLTVRAPDGTTDVLPPRSAQGRGPGLAAPLAAGCTQVCTWECTFVCRWVCTSVLTVTCAWSVLCGIPPLIIICAGACIVTVIAVCGWSCENYCGYSCRLWCDVIQESAA